MGDLHNRIAALSPDRLELLARRLVQRQQPAAAPAQTEAKSQAAPPSVAAALSAGDDPEALLVNMGGLSDAEVDVLLRQMLGAPEAPAVQRATPEELLENLDRYSEADVDSLIAELLAAQNDSNR